MSYFFFIFALLIQNIITMYNYFRLREFFPHCTEEEVQEVFNNKGKSTSLFELCRVLNFIRHRAMVPIIINSGYRGVVHNRRVGGVQNSQHLLMQAADIRSDSERGLMDLWRFITSSMDLNDIVGQCILYQDRHFIHVALPCPKHMHKTIYLK